MNTGLPGYCNKGIPVPRVLCHSLTEVTEVPGKGMGIFQNLQKFRVRVRKCYRTRRISGHGRTQLTEVPSRYKNAVPVPRVFVARAYRSYNSSGYGYEIQCRTELTEVPGTGMDVLQNLRNFFVGSYPG